MPKILENTSGGYITQDPGVLWQLCFEFSREEIEKIKKAAKK